MHDIKINIMYFEINRCWTEELELWFLWEKVKLEKHSLVFCTLGAISGMIIGFEVVSLNSGLPRRLLSLLSSVRWWILPYLPRRKSSLLFPSGSALPSPSFYWTGGQKWIFSNIFSLISREKKRLTFDSIPDFGAWQAMVLILVGLVGS